jgi:hypothetical protein
MLASVFLIGVLVAAFLEFPRVLLWYLLGPAGSSSVDSHQTVYWFLDCNPWGMNRSVASLLDANDVNSRRDGAFYLLYRPCLRIHRPFEPGGRFEFRPRGYWVGLPADVVTRLKAAALCDGDVDVRIRATQVLILYAYEEIERLLPRILAREDSRFRWQVVGVLANYAVNEHYVRAVPYLIDMLTDQDHEARQAAYYALRRITRRPQGASNAESAYAEEPRYDPSWTVGGLVAAQKEWCDWWCRNRQIVIDWGPLDPDRISTVPEDPSLLRQWR